MSVNPEGAHGPASSDGEYSARILAPIAAWLRANGGDEVVAAVCSAGNLDQKSLAAPGLLLGREQIETLLAAARTRLASDDAFMRACAFSPPGVQGPLRPIRHLATPWVLYGVAPALTWPVGPAGRFACIEHRRGFARVRYASDQREGRLLCLWRQSRAVQAPMWWDLPPATVRENACITDGDDACEYAISWYGRPCWTVGGLGGLAGLAILFALHRGAMPLGWLVAPFGVAIGHLVERRRSERANRERAAEFATAFRAAVAGAAPRLAGASRNGRTPAASSVPETEEPSTSFRLEGEFWRIVFAGTTALLRDSRGLALLVHLLRDPGREIHVAELDRLTPSGSGAGSEPTPAAPIGEETAPDLGDAGELLDARAKAEYRRRLVELREELEDAESCHDLGRAAIAREEIEAIGDQLRGALTPRGHERRAASHVERARVAVTRRIRAAIVQIAKHHPALGDHLSRSVRTGVFCSYVPQDGAVSWDT